MKLSEIAEKRPLYCLLAIGLLSVALKLIIVFQNPVINPDAVYYIELAKKFSMERKVFFYPPPLLPILISFVHIFIHDWIWAGRVVIILSMTLLCVPSYVLGSHLWNRCGGLATSLFVAVSPFFNKFACDLVKGPLFWLSGLFFIFFFLKYLRKRGPGYFLLTVIFFILALLSRREAILLGIPAIIIFIRQWLEAKSVTSKLPFALGIVGILFIVMLTPIVQHHNTQGKGDSVIYKSWCRFVKNQLTYFSVITNYKLLDKELRKLEKIHPGKGGTSYNFAEIARHYIPVVYLVGFVELLGRVIFPSFFLLSIIGIRDCWQNPNWSESRKVFWFFVTYLALGFVYLNSRNWIDKRYVLFAALLAHFWVWPGFVRLAEYLENKKPRISYHIRAIFVLIVILPLIKTATIKRGREIIIRDAALWIRQNAKLQGPIWSNDHRLAFYASRSTIIGLKENAQNTNEILKRAFANDVVYVILKVKKEIKPATCSHFRLIKKFTGQKKTIYIFERSDTG